jgi:hypothetical protein
MAGSRCLLHRRTEFRRNVVFLLVSHAPVLKSQPPHIQRIKIHGWFEMTSSQENGVQEKMLCFSWSPMLLF